MLSGTLNDIPAHILKNDGCHTNEVSNLFVEQNKNPVKLSERNSTVERPQKGSNEAFSKIILHETRKIEENMQTSRRTIANYWYDVLSRMP